MNTCSQRFSGKNIKSCEHIQWVKDSAGVYVINTELKKYWILVGIKEDIWQFLVMRIPYLHIIKVIEINLDLPHTSAEEVFFNQLNTWIDEGVIQLTEP